MYQRHLFLFFTLFTLFATCFQAKNQKSLQCYQLISLPDWLQGHVIIVAIIIFLIINFW